MDKYIKNRETGKIELHFEKSEYQALNETQKSKLKSSYLWSNYGKCWVSRAKDPNTYWAIKVAEELGFAGCEKVGERLSYAEQVEQKAERAENRAERYETYADNAASRAETLQAPLNKMHGDIAFFTQPIIAGHSGSQAFARYREKLYKKYEHGMDEYRKSGYYQERAETARKTADNEKLKDRVYLDNRIRECNKNIRDYQKRITSLEQNIYKIQQGETLRGYSGDIITAESLESRLEDILERYDAEQDKLNFFEDCLEKLGGIQFSQENIKTGYVVEVQRWGKVEVVSAGPVKIQIKTKYSVLTESYAAIEKIISSKPKTEDVLNPYKAGDILCLCRPADSSIYRAFQILKSTEKSVQIQEITIDNGIPKAGQFKPNSKSERKGITKSKYSNFIGAYYDGWQLEKYTA